MTTRSRTMTALTLVAVAMATLAFATTSANAEIIGELGVLDSSTGLSPGDQYRLAFVGSVHHDAVSDDIAVYNTFMQGLASAAGLGGTTWNVIGSTADVDARDNTGTNPSAAGVPIFLVDGITKVADDNADLWDGDVDHIIDKTETGGAPTSHLWVYSGSYWDGTESTGNPQTNGGPLGSGGEVTQGNGGVTTEWIWRMYTSDPHAPGLPPFGMSGVLTVGPYRSSFALATLCLLGLIGFAWRRKG